MLKAFIAISAIIFEVVGIGHLVRIVQGWQVQLGSTGVACRDSRTAPGLPSVGRGIRGAPRDALVADLSPAELRGASFGLRHPWTRSAFCLGRCWPSACSPPAASPRRRRSCACIARWHSANEDCAETTMPMRRIRLELARDHEFPEGSRERGYEFAAPLDNNGHLLAEEWRATRDQCRVKRFWAGENDEFGHLVHRRGGSWAFEYMQSAGMTMSRASSSIDTISYPGSTSPSLSTMP